LEMFCQEHCPTLDCPHWEETTVEAPILVPVPKPSYERELENVDPQEKIYLYEQGAATSELEN